MISNYKSQIQQKKLFCCHPAVLLQMPAKIASFKLRNESQITNIKSQLCKSQITNHKEGRSPRKAGHNWHEGIKKLNEAITKAKDAEEDAEEADKADVNKERFPIIDKQ